MQAGDIIPLKTQVATYDDTLFPLATVYDADGVEITDSPFALDAVDDSGYYSSQEAVMPDSPWVAVDIKFYTDSDHTTLSDEIGGTDYLVYLTSSSGGTSLPPTSNMVGVVDGAGCPGSSVIEDVITRGSARTLTMRIVEEISGEPFSLSGATLLECRFLNADGTVLSVKSSDAGSPVEVVSAGAGKMLCVLTASQTALLAVRTPSPFSVKITKSSGVTVVNFPTQLSVQQQDV
jgi:hypothetical protein